MADYITTYGGTHFIPTEPDPSGIHITDVAHALSMICRGNGHVKTFFSVGQHCIFCAQEAHARGYSDRIVLACLLHDASEAYLSDVPRPFKKEIPSYKIWEQRLLDVIYEKYLGSVLTEEEEEIIRQIDDDLLYFDVRDLLGEPMEEPEPKLMSEISHKVQPFEEVEGRYLELFERYFRGEKR